VRTYGLNPNNYLWWLAVRKALESPWGTSAALHVKELEGKCFSTLDISSTEQCCPTSHMSNQVKGL